MTRRVHLIVRGIVQGVGFRMYTMREAERLGLAGYVRNLPDGSVEIAAEGEAAAVDRLIAWAKHGPPGVVVEDVSVENGEPTGEFSDFGIRH
ncbi:MAG TPA: acylphosphatase [Gemmataceae bacterium]|nr:acylphosphatase [Gemmataceae bacterium]